MGRACVRVGRGREAVEGRPWWDVRRACSVDLGRQGGLSAVALLNTNLISK